MKQLFHFFSFLCLVSSAINAQEDPIVIKDRIPPNFCPDEHQQAYFEYEVTDCCVLFVPCNSAGGHTWDFGNGQTSENNGSSVQCYCPGTYTVTHTYYNNDINHTYIQNITIPDEEGCYDVDPMFSSEVLSFENCEGILCHQTCENVELQFLDETEGLVTAWEWKLTVIYLNSAYTSYTETKNDQNPIFTIPIWNGGTEIYMDQIIYDCNGDDHENSQQIAVACFTNDDPDDVLIQHQGEEFTTIKLSAHYLGAQYTLFDLSGAMIEKGEISNSSFTLSARNNASGVHLLQLRGKDYNKTFKIFLH